MLQINILYYTRRTSVCFFLFISSSSSLSLFSLFLTLSKSTGFFIRYLFQQLSVPLPPNNNVPVSDVEVSSSGNAGIGKSAFKPFCKWVYALTSKKRLELRMVARSFRRAEEPTREKVPLFYDVAVSRLIGSPWARYSRKRVYDRLQVGDSRSNQWHYRCNNATIAEQYFIDYILANICPRLSCFAERDAHLSFRPVRPSDRNSFNDD